MRGKGDHTPPDDMQACPPDNVSGIVMQQVMAYADGAPVIHFESAREIAAWWHSPAARDVGFCTFSHTGRIVCDLVHEIHREITEQAKVPGKEAADNIGALRALEAYVIRAGWECPGARNLSACDYIWSADSGCAPKWSYSDESGYSIDGSVTAERDAHSKALWSGPDGPDEVWERDSEGNWERVS